MSSFTSQNKIFITLCLVIYGYLIHTVTSYKDTHHNELSLDAFPNPLISNNIASCGRERESFICDPNQFLNPKTADAIDKIIANATKSNLVWCSSIVEHFEGEGAQPNFIANPNEKTRENYNGVQIGVAIISSFRRYSHTRLRRSDDIAKKSTVYAKSIHDQWGVGEAGCNNAALIFINIFDRYLYVSTGSGIKKTINDAFIEKFIIPKYIKPLMRASKYSEAVQLIVESIIEILRESDNLEQNKLYQEYIHYTKPAAFLGILYETWFIVILVLCGVSYLGYKFYSERDYRECERKLARLYARKQAQKFAGKSCPICLEEFPLANDSDAQNNARETAILICGHKFCKACLDSWFSSQSASNQKCPICRHDRDDWSAVRGSGDGTHEQKRSDNDDEKGHVQSNGDEVDEKKELYQNDDIDRDMDEKHDDFAGRSSYKTSTSDTFYDNENTNMNTQSVNGGAGNGFGFRRRGRNRYNNGGMGMNDWMFQQELMFRMMRMRYYYPRYVTSDMTNRWSGRGYTGRFTRDESFVRSNPNYRPPASSSSGSSWSSGRSSGFSFGGGSSSGGGGGGGGW